MVMSKRSSSFSVRPLPSTSKSKVCIAIIADLSVLSIRMPIQLTLSLFLVLDHAGVTPLIEAVRNGRVEIVRVLLEKGVSSMTRI